MKRHSYIVYFFFLLSALTVRSQDEHVNLQTYTSGSLLKKGQFDVTSFNSIYTEKKNNWDGVDYSGYRVTFASSLWQITYGVSKSARLNLGVDINLKGSGRASTRDSYTELNKAFSFSNTDFTRTGIAYIAPRIKLMPIKALPDFTIQSSFITSFVKFPEGGSGLYWLEWDRLVWWNQLYYSKMLANDKIQLFTEIDVLFRFAKYNHQSTHVDIPLNLFISWFPSKNLTLYAMTQHVPRFVLHQKETDWVLNANYTQSGVGIKYRVTPSLNLEVLYSNFWRSKNSGQGETINFGIKYVR